MEDVQQKTPSPFDFWKAVIAFVVTLGVPAIMWGGKMDSRMDNVEQQQRSARMESREDMREIKEEIRELNRKIALVVSERERKRLND